MKKIVGYILIGITLLLYIFWFGTDIIDRSTYDKIIPPIMIMLPIIGYKLIKKSKKNEKV
jgi:hypothetical protein